MELVSEPAFEEIPVTHLDVVYLGGGIDNMTLRAADTYEVLAENIVVYFADTQERVYIERRNVLCFRTKPSTIRRPLDAPTLAQNQ